jgi:hypothetical protein
MKQRIRITSIRREPIDPTLLAQVLIELVLFRREQERLKAAQAEQAQPPKEDLRREPS